MFVGVHYHIFLGRALIFCGVCIVFLVDGFVLLVRIECFVGVH